jgi:hypothetical protein
VVVDKSDRVDGDAGKKALTDGITKALSYLGFNSDVFMGKFDDNKYVQERAAEEKKAAEPEPEPEPYSDDDKLLDEEVCNTFINDLTDMVEKNAAMTAIKKRINEFNPTFKPIGERNPHLNSAVRAAVKEAKETTTE